MIGIIGGIGPEAGNYLHRLIIENTIAVNDYNHFNVILYSANNIPDRGEFIENKTNTNPAFKIIDIIEKLINLGVKVVVIACNQVYDASIFRVISENVLVKNIVIINVINETFKLISKSKNIKTIGILSRTGIYKSRMFEQNKHASEYKFIYLDSVSQDELDFVIGDEIFGIKGGFHKKSSKPKRVVESSIQKLIQKGADIIVLACTELALVVDYSMYKNYNIVDTNQILARATIRRLNKNKLKQK